MAAPSINEYFALHVARTVQGGRYDPSVVPTGGDPGSLFIQLPPTSGGTGPFALWQKQSPGQNTDWAEITGSATGITAYKNPVQCASVANVPLAGATPLTIDGVLVTDQMRILLKNQGTASQNGIYVATISGGSYTLARSADANISAEVKQGMFTWVLFGTVNADTGWILTTPNPIVLGTTALAFAQIPLPGSLSMGAIGSLGTSPANGAVISGGILALQYASGVVPGLLSLAAQNIVGDKSFSNPISGFGQNNVAPVVAGGTATLFADDIILGTPVPGTNIWRQKDANGNVRVLNGIVQDTGVDVVTAPQFFNIIGAASVTPNGLGVDIDVTAPAAQVWERETFVLAGPTASQALAFLVNHNSVIVTLEGAASPLFEGTDYTLSDAAVTSVNFSLAIQAGMLAGQKLAVQYVH